MWSKGSRVFEMERSLRKQERAEGTDFSSCRKQAEGKERDQV